MEKESEHTRTTALWLEGIPYEVAFWNNTYRWNHTFEGLMRWSHFGGAIQLDGFDANAFLATRESPLVLDIGAGLSYAPGNHLSIGGELRPLDIHYVDPLAHYFNEIRHRHHRRTPDIEFGMVEFLSAFYPQGGVALAIIQNALDHSAMPVKGIYEALEVLSPEGILYLNHHPNEAEAERYKGFHQWNITEEGGELVVWNQKERHNVSKLVEGFAQVTTSRGKQGNIIAILRKTAHVPQHLICDKTDKRMLCEQLLHLSSESTNVGRSIKQKAKYGTFNAIQFIAQALPLDKRMKLKRLLTWKRT